MTRRGQNYVYSKMGEKKIQQTADQSGTVTWEVEVMLFRFADDIKLCDN